MSNCALDNKHWIFSSEERFISLATPFLPILKWIPIPFFYPNCRNWSLYSTTLSIWSTLIFQSVYFFIIFFYFTNIFRTSNLCLKRYTQHRLDISSINKTKYRWPPRDAVLVGLHQAIQTAKNNMLLRSMSLDIQILDPTIWSWSKHLKTHTYQFLLGFQYST